MPWHWFGRNYVCQIDVRFFKLEPAMSSSLPRTESARINLRTSPEAKALIERAAANLLPNEDEIVARLAAWKK